MGLFFFSSWLALWKVNRNNWTAVKVSFQKYFQTSHIKEQPNKQNQTPLSSQVYFFKNCAFEAAKNENKRN